MTGRGIRAGTVLIEARRVGALLRVAAVHEATGVEAVVFGPASAGQAALAALAAAKLRALLARAGGRAQNGGSNAPPRAG